MESFHDATVLIQSHRSYHICHQQIFYIFRDLTTPFANYFFPRARAHCGRPAEAMSASSRLALNGSANRDLRIYASRPIAIAASKTSATQQLCGNSMSGVALIVKNQCAYSIPNSHPTINVWRNSVTGEDPHATIGHMNYLQD